VESKPPDLESKASLMSGVLPQPWQMLPGALPGSTVGCQGTPRAGRCPPRDGDARFPEADAEAAMELGGRGPLWMAARSSSPELVSEPIENGAERSSSSRSSRRTDCGGEQTPQRHVELPEDAARRQLQDCLGAEGLRFFSGMAVLSPESKNRAMKAAAVLQQHRELCFMVTGYTNPPSGQFNTQALCVELGLQRAGTVLGVLVDAGCSNDRIAVRGAGHIDNRGPRVEIAPCHLNEVLQSDAEASLARLASDAEASLTPLASDAEAALTSSATAAAPEPSMRVDFEYEGSVKVVHFKWKPFGICFDKQSPIRITVVEPRSQAAELGVQVGWCFKTVNGEDVTRKDFDSLFALLKAQAASLPSGPSR